MRSYPCSYPRMTRVSPSLKDGRPSITLAEDCLHRNRGGRLVLVAPVAVGRRGGLIGSVGSQQGAGRLWKRGIIGRGERIDAILTVHRVEMRRPAIHVQLKNIRPVVVAGEIMPQLGEDAELEIAVGVQN